MAARPRQPAPTHPTPTPHPPQQPTSLKQGSREPLKGKRQHGNKVLAYLHGERNLRTSIRLGIVLTLTHFRFKHKAIMNNTVGLYRFATEVSVEDLSRLMNIRTVQRPLPGLECLVPGFDRKELGVDCDAVHAGLFIGDRATALSKLYLHHMGITHIINAAEGNYPGMVETSANYYADYPVLYMGLPINDHPTYNIYQHFGAATDFIEQGIKSGGRVLVHCLKGKSRSATLVLAYFMMKLQLPAPLALKMCLQCRAIRPNVGFLQQIVNLDNFLRHTASQQQQQ